MFKWLKMLYIRWRFPVGSKAKIVGHKEQWHAFKVNTIVKVTGYDRNRALLCRGISRNSGNEVEQIVYFKNAKPFSR